MARKDKDPYSMSEEEWEEFLDAERIFFKLREDEKEFTQGKHSPKQWIVIFHIHI